MLPRGAVIVAVLALGAPAHADVAWEAPAGCPPADEVRAQIEAHLRRPIDGAVEARMVVERAGRRWRVVMTTSAGERTLEASSCRDVAESAALILAMTIAESTPPEPEPEPEIEIDPAPEVDEVAAADDPTDDETPPLPDLRREYRDDPYREPSPPVDIDVRFRALVGGDLGTLPSPAAALGGAIEVAFDGWSADVGVERFTEQQAVKPGMPMQGADVALTTITARGCYSGGPRRWRAGGCLGAELAVMHAAGFGFDSTTDARTFGGGPQFGAMYALRVLGPVAVRADATATYLVVRPVLVDGDGVIIHDPNLLVWRGFVGVEATWE